MGRLNRAIFLDRDGVINDDIDLLKRVGDIRMIDDSDKAIRMFNDLGLKVIVVTNQPQVAKGNCSEDDVRKINEEIKKRLADNGAEIDAFYYCPHHPEKGFTGERTEYKIDCGCRKPGIGMLEQAKRDFDLDLRSSFMIGDRTIDVKTGLNAGCKTILVKTGYAGGDRKYDVKADYICNNIYDAATLVKRLEDIRQMRCIIIAGGRGERLRPMTDEMPKAMLKIDGKPILEHQIELLKRGGITDIVICGYYLFDKIREYFRDGKKFDVNINYCYEGSPLGTGGAIKNAEEFIDSTALVLYGDEMIDMNIERLIEFHNKNNAGLTMVLHETDHPHDSDLVSVDNNGKVTELHKKPNKFIPSILSKSSIYVIEPSVVRYMPGGRFDLDGDFISSYIANGDVYGYVTNEFIKDIGTRDRLEMVDKRVRSEKIERLSEKSRTIRKHIISMIAGAGSGHPGGSLSCADIITALFFGKMRYKAVDPKWESRDRFVLSKGHAAPALYAALAEAGFFSTDELKNLRKIGSILQGHPSTVTPGVEICSGSLGQGLSVANGMAIAGNIDKRDYHVYVLIGDGESQEGQIWEAAMTAAHYKLNNLTAIIDRNGLQIDGKTEDIMSLEPLADKWRAFGWEVIEVDGHSFEELLAAMDKESEKPKMIIANTVKGKGVSFMEHNVDFHGTAPSHEEAEKALRELCE